MNCKIVKSKKKTSVEKLYISNLGDEVSAEALVKTLDYIDLKVDTYLELSFAIDESPELYLYTDQLQTIHAEEGTLLSYKRAHCLSTNLLNQFGGGNHLVGSYFELTPEGPVMSIPYANNFFDTLSFNQTVDLAEGRIVFTADVTSVPWAEEGQTEELTGDLRLYFKNMSVKTVEKEGN